MASENHTEQSESDDSTLEDFNVRSITLQLQNQMVGTLPSCILRMFLDDASVRLFDNICGLFKLYSGSSRLATMYIKRIVKMNVRLTIYSSSDILNEEEVNLTYDFHDRCHLAAEIVLRLGRPTHRLMPGVTPTIEKLLQTVEESRDLALRIMERHLSEQTREKFREAVDRFTKMDFFNCIFGEEDSYKELMEKIYNDIEDLMDRGLF
ncbi:Tumor necrosis factor alpha-induced protein 8 protein 2 [Paragonimus heterotremus]|uniref:Tumor necrosis factor alpha-induced protein 8 protein 2 n=1 Tax=Paragonimus heterotremus TaxID=100268 RepID=A0A8J4WJB6_9TREM|nr:Tumor necrosis factor alpha-induced protein 8 protein 2 [Paragonimus heterotremus]